ncbi:MAG: 50S ribosomal protein L36 [Pyrinomonadaceae bacterium]
MGSDGSRGRVTRRRKIIKRSRALMPVCENHLHKQKRTQLK